MLVGDLVSIARAPAVVSLGDVERLRDALKAKIVMSDRGPQPRKLDDALCWKANEDLVDEMVAAALAKLAVEP